MQARKIIIAVAGVAVLCLVALLLLESRGDSKTAISAEKKARALAEFERRSRLAQPPAPAADTPVRRRPVARASAESSEPATRGAPPPKPIRGPMEAARAVRASQLAPAVKLGGNGDDDEVKEQTENVRQSYDTGNYVDAQKLSLEALEKSPRNIKLLRYVVSSSCAVGEVETAREYAERLPKRDRDQMAKRCRQNWGAEL